MAIPSELVPKEKERVIDLVEEAGLDITDWANFAGGKARAASNPKYCYEWAFIEPNKAVVLNLWLNSMAEKNGHIVQQLKVREWSGDVGRSPSVWPKRAEKIEEAIRTAYSLKLPVRVIVCDGIQREPNDTLPSQVKTRLLDSKTWAVTAYDVNTSACTITRDVTPSPFLDQFDLADVALPEKLLISTTAYQRSRQVRKEVQVRSKGRCEYCGELGFLMTNGGVYIETHHVIPLSEGGLDVRSNVTALCADHHRQAHYGKNKLEIRTFLRAQLRDS
jgi:hypothetical protein